VACINCQRNDDARRESALCVSLVQGFSDREEQFVHVIGLSDETLDKSLTVTSKRE
jgi:hypothetical protein